MLSFSAGELATANVRRPLGGMRTIDQSPTQKIEDAATIIDVVHWRARQTPDLVAARSLTGGTEGEAWSYHELALHATRIADGLGADAAGQRVLLLYEPELELIAAVLGTMQAGAIAIPSCPPGGRRAAARIAAIEKAARPNIVLASSLDRATHDGGELHAGTATRWLGTRALELPQELPQLPQLDRWSLALLQYTSQSTGEPRGVMVSHAKLISNSRALVDALTPGRPWQGCDWLPPHHDMGLMGGILLPLYAGYPVTLFSPTRFVQRPSR
jgi:acyl-CoA synthetase (AMP-forming)/AMP-acid ligase II